MIQVSTKPSEETTADSSPNAGVEFEKSATSCLPNLDEVQVLVTSTGNQQSPSRSSNFGNNIFTNATDQELRPHRSRLPLALYLLSFAPPFHPRSADVTWRDIVSHPYVLYAFGVLAALPAGVTRPALNLMYGYWTTGVTAKGATPGDITARGIQVGWIMAMVGVVMLLCSWIFLACCRCCHLAFSLLSSHCAIDSLRSITQIVRAAQAHLSRSHPGARCCLFRQDWLWRNQYPCHQGHRGDSHSLWGKAGISCMDIVHHHYCECPEFPSEPR